MSKVYFRNIEKEDLNQVFVLLNQLKPMDISKVDPEKAWDNFVSNSSSNSIVAIMLSLILTPTLNLMLFHFDF